MKKRQVNLAYLLVLLFATNSIFCSNNSAQAKEAKSQKAFSAAKQKKIAYEKKLKDFQKTNTLGKKFHVIQPVLEFKRPITLLSELIRAFIPEISKTLQKTDVAVWQENDNGYFNINLTQLNNSGYAFIQDPWNKTPTFFDPSTKTGIAGLSILDPAYQTLSSIFKLKGSSITNSSVTLLFLGFDKNGKYIDDIIKTPPTTFGLYAYDQNGKLLKNFPISFDPTHTVDLGGYTLTPKATGPATGAFGIFNGPSIAAPKMKYPFAAEISVHVPFVFATQPVSKKSLGLFAGSFNFYKDYSDTNKYPSINPYTQAWLAVSFNPGQTDHHVLMDLINKQGLTNKTEEYMLPSMQNFHHVDRPTLEGGIIFSFIEYNNKSYVCAQALSKYNRSKSDMYPVFEPFPLNENYFLGWAPLINAPHPLPDTYVITGAEIFEKISESKGISFAVTTSCTPKDGSAYSHTPYLTEFPESVNIPHPLIWPGFDMYDVQFYREIDYSSQPLTLFFLWMLDSKTGNKVGVGNIPIEALNAQLKKSSVVLKFVYDDTKNQLTVTGYNADTNATIPSLSFTTATTPLSDGQVPEGYIRYSYQAGANPLEYHIPKNRDITLEELKGGVSILIKNK